jgi:predicted unusual protein kinase regulating ubiquinone biosynthesis (AarF/ABC1/UbiB family)
MMPSLRRANLARYKDIAWLLLKYGRSDFIEACGLGELAAGAKPADDDSSRARGDNLARDLETMGPTFVKLGQVLSTRADLLPRPYLESLARLQDRVEPFPFDQARQTIEEDLGVSLGEAFAVVEPEPMAAASLGQVHRAVLLTGEPVVVKVQRPGVRQQIQRDLEALQEIARVLDSHTDFGRRYRLLDVLRQFRRTLIEEMDYTQEASNCRPTGSAATKAWPWRSTSSTHTWSRG